MEILEMIRLVSGGVAIGNASFCAALIIAGSSEIAKNEQIVVKHLLFAFTLLSAWGFLIFGGVWFVITLNKLI
jgi:hypothetical protein